MKVALPIAFAVLLASSCVVEGNDYPASNAYSGCRVKWNLKCASKVGAAVQMGQCWANQRVNNQKSAFFVPVPTTAQEYTAEGGPYGTCTAFDCHPAQSDLQYSASLTDWCFFWDDKANPVQAFGISAVPMPIVCPSNLQNCPSAFWYEPGNKLSAYGDWKPTYKGIWFPPKNPITKQPMFCQGLDLGCWTPTNRDLQLHRLALQNCDVSKCKPPPIQDSTLCKAKRVQC